MKKKAIVIDLDNTLIDTAVRKLQILQEEFGLREITINDVKKDYWLMQILGGPDSEIGKRFFEKLDTEESIKKYKALLFEGAEEILRKYSSKGYILIIITGRLDSLYDVTIEELENLEITKYITKIYFRKVNENLKTFKSRILEELNNNYDILALIGDRPEDIDVASRLNIPAIIFRTTMSSKEILSYPHQELKGGAFCNSWNEIDVVLETIISGRKKLEELREMFIQQYANWLKDIDDKCRITSTISGVIIALCGKILFDISKSLNGINKIESIDYILVLTLITAVFSLLYSIRGYIPRYTSGPKAGNIITTKIKQWIAILLNFPEKWLSQRGDAIYLYKCLLNSSEKQEKAHIDFFISNFGTYDPEALLNLRLFQLKASNYIKAYSANISAFLLLISIILFLIWLILKPILK